MAERTLSTQHEPSLVEVARLEATLDGLAEHAVLPLDLVDEGREFLDLVVTDLLMPNMGGLELATRMKQLHPETKVLFMSGYPDEAIRSQEGLTEDVEIMQKPFSMKSLAAKARSILEHR